MPIDVCDTCGSPGSANWMLCHAQIAAGEIPPCSSGSPNGVNGGTNTTNQNTQLGNFVSQTSNSTPVSTPWYCIGNINIIDPQIPCDVTQQGINAITNNQIPGLPTLQSVSIYIGAAILIIIGLIALLRKPEEIAIKTATKTA